jgi:hypothetical protein
MSGFNSRREAAPGGTLSATCPATSTFVFQATSIFVFQSLTGGFSRFDFVV